MREAVQWRNLDPRSISTYVPSAGPSTISGRSAYGLRQRHLILESCRRGVRRIVSSPAHDVEIAAYAEDRERRQVEASLRGVAERPDYDMCQCRSLAASLANGSLGPADAAHVAFAIAAGADFVSCDDRLLKRLKRLSLSIWTGSPTEYCQKGNLR